LDRVETATSLKHACVFLVLKKAKAQFEKKIKITYDKIVVSAGFV
jgi:hypothetical protein